MMVPELMKPRTWSRVGLFATWMAVWLLSWARGGDVCAAENRVLRLDGAGGHLRIPSKVLEGLDAATVECWVRYDALSNYAPVFSFGKTWQAASVCLVGLTAQLQFFIYDANRDAHVVKSTGGVPLGQWFHCAVVMGPGGMRLYLDGILVASGNFKGTGGTLDHGGDCYVGKPHWVENQLLNGAVDEFRIWRGERTAEQIRGGRFQRMTGREEGLVGLWNFDAGDARDTAAGRNDGELVGRTTILEVANLTTETTRRIVVVSGVVNGVMGRPLEGADVVLQTGGKPLERVKTGVNGEYAMFTFAEFSRFDLLATSGGVGGRANQARWHRGLVPEPRRMRWDFDLLGGTGIAGTVSGLDGTPHDSVCVELLSGGRVQQRVMSGVRGEFSFPSVEAGRYRVRCVDGLALTGPELQANVEALGRQSAEIELGEYDFRSGLDLRFAPAGGRGAWRLVTSNDGLTANQVTATQPGLDGRMWIGTSGGGVMSYDGTSFFVLDRSNGLPSNEVVALDMDAQGKLWIATPLGISSWDGVRVETFATASELLDLHVTRTGRVILGSRDGLFELSGGRLRRVENAPWRPCFSVTSDAAGRFWIGLEDQLGCLDGGTYSKKDVPAVESPVGVTDVVTDLEGRVWFLAGMGVHMYDGVRVTHFGLAEGLEGIRFYGLMVDRRGRIWAAGRAGLYHYTGSGFVRHAWPARGAQGEPLVQEATPVPSMSGVNLLRMGLSEDRSGGIWAPTTLGVYRYDPESVVSFTTADGLPTGRVTTAALRRDGKLAMGTADYFVVVADLEGLRTGVSKGLAAVTVVDREKHWPLGIAFGQEDRLWLAARWGGVRLFEGETFAFKRELSSAHGLENFATCVWEAANGDLWVGTEMGVRRVTPSPTVSVLPVTQQLGRVRASCIMGDMEGRVWMGGEEGELLCWENNQLRSLEGKGYEGRSPVRSMASTESGMMWVGTESGLLRVASVYNGERIQRFSREDGLPSNLVQSICPDGKGGIWVGTAAGLCRFDGVVWTVLDSRDGLVGNDVRHLARDQEGRVWVVCANGVSCYTPDTLPPRVEIDGVEIEGREGLGDSPLRTEKDVPFTVRYRSVDLQTIGKKQRFQVRWSGPEPEPGRSEWSVPVTATRFAFTPRRVGLHVFEVRALDRDVNPSLAARLEFEVVIPWWQTAAARLLFGGIFLGSIVVAGGYGRKYYQQRRRSTELQAELLARERSANRAKSLFLANMSHDIRTPLNAILGYSQILQRMRELPESARLPVDTIRQSGTGLLSLINSILDISKIEAGSLELQEALFDLGNLITNLSTTTRLACEQKGIDWVVVWAPAGGAGYEPWPEQSPRLRVFGDEVKVRRVLGNVLSNAVKYTDRGRVTFRIAMKEGNWGEGMGSVGKTRFEFEVDDTGPGISETLSEAVFEPFLRSRTTFQKEGHGLGLAIARKLVMGMGGELSYTTKLGQGSSFRVEIPLLLDVADASPEPVRAGVERTALKAGQTVTALVVDDLLHNREVLRRFLELLGVEVGDVSSGEEALDWIVARRPQIVMMDVWMPGMDGIETARRLRGRLGAQCPRLVAHSASSLTHEREQYLRDGFDDFLAKPTTLERVQECLVTNLGLEFEAIEDPARSAPAQLHETIPEALLKRMLAAAENYSSTELMQLIEEFEGVTGGSTELAQRLRRFNEQSDMPNLVAVLRKVSAGSEVPEP